MSYRVPWTCSSPREIPTAPSNLCKISWELKYHWYLCPLKHQSHLPSMHNTVIFHIQYIKILIWYQGFLLTFYIVHQALFSLCVMENNSQMNLRKVVTSFWSESLRVMFKYVGIKCKLSVKNLTTYWEPFLFSIFIDNWKAWTPLVTAHILPLMI